jgi:hypothetical protein
MLSQHLRADWKLECISTLIHYIFGCASHDMEGGRTLAGWKDPKHGGIGPDFSLIEPDTRTKLVSMRSSLFPASGRTMRTS